MVINKVPIFGHPRNPGILPPRKINFVQNNLSSERELNIHIPCDLAFPVKKPRKDPVRPLLTWEEGDSLL